MKLDIDLRKSAQQNAAHYFELSKKARRKLEGVEKALQVTRKKLEKEQAAGSELTASDSGVVKKRSKKWYEKFHWFFSSDEVLVLAGKDAQSNENLVKKYMEQEHLYFHADIQGAGHVVVQCKGNKAPARTLKEAAEFAAAYSSAWKGKLASVDVFSALPEQVSKKAPSGESIATGGFMVYGKREWYRKTPLHLALGAFRDKDAIGIMAGPPSAIRKHTAAAIEVVPGALPKSVLAKQAKARLEKELRAAGKINLDDIIASLPAGSFDIRAPKE